MTSKEALETIANIELYHREFDEDEDFDGDWKYLEYTEYDGLVREVYKQEIDTIKKDLARLEALETENEQLKDSIQIKQKQVNKCIDTLTQKIEKLKKAIKNEITHLEKLIEKSYRLSNNDIDWLLEYEIIYLKEVIKCEE